MFYAEPNPACSYHPRKTQLKKKTLQKIVTPEPFAQAPATWGSILLNLQGVGSAVRRQRESFAHSLGTRAVDPHSFFADLDPAVFLNADPDPAVFCVSSTCLSCNGEQQTKVQAG